MRSKTSDRTDSAVRGGRQAGRLGFSLAAAILACLLVGCSNPASTVEEGTESNPHLIRTAADLNAMRGGVEGYEDWESFDYFKLMNDIDLSSYGDWTPIGSSYTDYFVGRLDGNGHKIIGLTIKESASDYQGLFGYIDDSRTEIKNLGLTEVKISGTGSDVGGLVGFITHGTITNCYSEGSVSGNYYVGGLIGDNYGGEISECRSACAVTGEGKVGGFAGSNTGTISQCCAEGSAQASAGSNVYTVGGFAGVNDQGTIADCYATGAVSGFSDIGGFTGNNQSGSITDCYSIGTVTGTTTYVGGFAGYSGGTITACFYDSTTSGMSDTYGGTAKTTAEMKAQGTYSGWYFTSIWGIDEDTSYPYLLWER
jgi:hypothetical protein